MRARRERVLEGGLDRRVAKLESQRLRPIGRHALTVDEQLRELGDMMQARRDTIEAMWDNPLLRPVKKLQSVAHKMLPTKVKTAKATAIGAALRDTQR